MAPPVQFAAETRAYIHTDTQANPHAHKMADMQDQWDTRPMVTLPGDVGAHWDYLCGYS